MKRGGSAGGGQSSLGYLFGSDNKQTKNEAAPPPPVSPTTYLPPYGIDKDEKPPEKSSIASPNSPAQSKSPSYDYPRIQGQNSGHYISGRPSTKVKSVPGGDSSLGYLFGDK